MLAVVVICYIRPGSTADVVTLRLNRPCMVSAVEPGFCAECCWLARTNSLRFEITAAMKGFCTSIAVRAS